MIKQRGIHPGHLKITSTAPNFCNNFKLEFHICTLLPGFVMSVIVYNQDEVIVLVSALIVAKNVAENKQTIYYVH